VFGEMFYLFNCRSITRPFWSLGVWSNRPFWLGLLIMTGLQLMFTYLAPFQRVFGSAAIGLFEWGLVLGNSLLIFCVVEAEKWLRRRTGAS
jgi:Ca2+-transporting ATPase